MSEDIVINVEKVCKRFRLRLASRTLKAAVLEAVLHRAPAGPREYQALDNVSFNVRKGETLGIIGANGAGKSTLLALVSRTMKPTSGIITTRGSISCLLELGAGFHPDLSGRENVYLYGAIMGLTRKQMSDKFDRIVDFAELRDWIDEPVKHYSSGMYVRLAFAVAVEVDPDILLIDEVLAVGDAAFQTKCGERMKEFRERGKTMLIISHDLPTVESISDRILFLEEGRVHGLGETTSMVEDYRRFMRRKEEASAKRVWGNHDIMITGVDMMNPDGSRAGVFKSGKPAVIRIKYHAKGEIRRPVFGFSISDSSGRVVYGNNTQIENFVIPSVKGDGAINMVVDPILVARGDYLLSLSVHSEDHLTNYCRMDHAFVLKVECDRNYEGSYMPVKWSLE